MMKEKGSLDFEINLAPIIDCFTVLVSFLLVSSAFISIGILDAGIAAPSAEARSPAEVPPVQVSIEVQESHAYQIVIEGKEKRTTTVTDLAQVRQNLESIKQRYPKVDGLILSAQDGVPYKDLVASMEALRKVMPYIVLGGF